MAKRAAKESDFATIPAGEQIVRVKEIDTADYKTLDKLTVVVEDKDGNTAKINYSFVKEDNTPNDVADSIYTRMGRTILDNPTLDEVDSDDLIGGFAFVEIVHKVGSKGGTFANVGKWLAPATGFDTVKAVTTKDAPKTAPKAAPKQTAAEMIAALKAKNAAK